MKPAPAMRRAAKLHAAMVAEAKVAQAEAINHPPHYNAHPSGVECIDVVEHMNFNLGNAVKYIWRAGLKGPDHLTDLKKAAWYVNREIERLQRKPKP